jgi:K+-transporting ATPase KdpF subunit
LRFSARLLGLHQGLRQAVGEIDMDYIIAGVASLGVFVYLVYALLRPEKF